MADTTPSIKFMLDLPIVATRDDFSSPQKCHLPVDFFPASVAKSSMAICRSSKNRNYVCRLYSSKNLSPQNHCHLDKSVEILPNNLEFRSEKLHRDDERLQAIQMLNYSPVVPFDRLSVDIIVKTADVDYKLLSSFERLVDIVADVLGFFTFHEQCLISTKALGAMCGITDIIVNSTSCELPQQLGTIDRATCSVTIDKIYFDNLVFSTNSLKSLGGLSVPAAALDNFMATNMDYVQNSLGAKPACQLLLIGPCGSGKTSLVENLSNQHNCCMVTLKSHDVIRAHPGETEAQLRKVFENAKKFMTTIGDKYLSLILIEDIEELCPKDVKGHDKAHISRISSQLKALLDDVTKNTKGLLVIATTSSVEQLDTSVRRPGRLEQEVLIPMPTEMHRKEILTILLEAVGTIHSAFHERIVKFVSRRTHGYVGADLEVLLKHVGRKMAKQKEERQVLDEIIQIFLDSLKIVRPTVLKDNLGLVSRDLPNFSTIGGMEEVKRTLQVSVLGPLHRPEAFARFNMSPPKGVLFYGPPGCAKTTFAKCLAQESKMTFIAVSAAEIYSPYVGSAEKLIVKLFNQARMSSPAIIFLDEIDALVGNRTGAGSNPNPVQQRILSTLLTEMDGIGIAAQSAFVTNTTISNHILVIAATNRPDMIDNALMRPGRFDKLIYIPAPDPESRHKILEVMAKKMPFDNDVDLGELATLTERFSGADLCNLCNEAGLEAITQSFDATNIRMAHFNNVLEYIRPSLTREQIRWYDDYETQLSVV